MSTTERCRERNEEVCEGEPHEDRVHAQGPQSLSADEVSGRV